MEFIRKSQFVLHGMKHFIKRQKPFRKIEGDLSGQRVLVTGASTGLGLGIAIDLAKRGAIVHVLCRNKKRGEEAVSKIELASGNNEVLLHLCDMGEIKQIKAFCEQFLANYKDLHILVNNAGCMVNKRETTSEGLEKNFAANTLGTYYLTKLLVPLLKASKPSRVITVSSGGMLTQKLELEDLQMEKEDFDGTKQYAINKRHQVALMEFFARAYMGQGVLFCSMHPGWVDTDGVKESMPDFHKRFEKDLRNIEEGIDTVIYLCLVRESAIAPGEFYFDREIADKHLTIASTSYKDSKVDALVGQLERMVAGIVI